MTKKRFISVIFVLSVLASVLTIGMPSVAAVSKPTLYAPTNIKGGQRVTWSHAGASRYYLYFGVYDYKTQKPQWRVYREVKGTSYDINYTSLHSSGWKKYVNYTPTSNLTSGQVYCYQVHAGNINASGRPIDKNYSSVRTMTYLHAPYLNYAIEGNQIALGGYTQGANGYQYRYKKESWSGYHYAENITPNYVSWIYDATYSDKCIYEARAVLKTQNNGTAYSAWASIKLPY